MPVPPRWRRRLRAWLRRSSFAWWAGVGVLALVTLVFVRSSLSAAAGLTARYGAPRAVPVVVAPVAAGEVVPAGAVAVVERPSATVPDGEVVEAGGWAGRTALVPLVPGEVLLAAKVAPAGLRGAAALLPDGMRALAVASGPGGRPPLAVGDHVDVLATVADAGGGEGGDPTVVVAAGALVLAVDREADTVTVAVPAADAPLVATAIATATVTLALAGA